MRNLKFRGICLASGNMVFGGGIDTQRDTPKIINNGVVYYVDAKSIGQFTGLTDKNCVDIYEGDIVKDNYLGKIGVIFYHGSYCQFKFNCGIINSAINSDIEVIGNTQK